MSSKKKDQLKKNKKITMISKKASQTEFSTDKHTVKTSERDICWEAVLSDAIYTWIIGLSSAQKIIQQLHKHHLLKMIMWYDRKLQRSCKNEQCGEKWGTPWNREAAKIRAERAKMSSLLARVQCATMHSESVLDFQVGLLLSLIKADTETERARIKLFSKVNSFYD